MSKGKWTPGPWHVGSDHEDGPFVGGGGYCRANLVGPAADRMANARLMAAAPDLYEMLELVIGSLDFDREDDLNKEVLRRINVTLAKARGEA